MNRCLAGNKAVKVGLGMLSLAIVANHFLNVHDFAKGLLYGISIGFLLMGIYRKSLSK